ncbi:hypothetical protein BCR43DRAFT_492037 [Syncephalastrum racemosum]|uniref:Uncharacterized protein n=1 Tax=Syncephalastrum racemosum TaxID=13706 RepID=A0A1X2HCY3_SYNRA|nr:hypothetical protein BCR43DRAFT_492037 [Syncephalastrum racemosum]
MVVSFFHALPPVKPTTTSLTSRTTDRFTHSISEKTPCGPLKQSSFDLSAVYRQAQLLSDVIFSMFDVPPSIYESSSAITDPLARREKTTRNLASPPSLPRPKSSVAEPIHTPPPPPPAAAQKQPAWTRTHAYVRDTRVNSDGFRILSAEHSMMQRSKITRPLRNRRCLDKREDNFIFGRRSSLRTALIPEEE